MATNSRFRMKLATLTNGICYTGLDFRSYMEVNTGLHDQLIADVCGAETDYGKLFAYCFRRFGYPNMGWSGYKELAKYLLTTPHPDMILSIVPYVGGTSVSHFRFWVPVEADMAVEAYARRFRDAWKVRAMDWREPQGLPDWMGEWMAFCNGTLREVFRNRPEHTNWRETAGLGVIGKEGSRLYEMTKRAQDFFEQIHNDYQNVEPCPPYHKRSANWRTWGADDPLKPFAEAAFVALKDLHLPVGVCDQAINAFGNTEFGHSYAKAAAVSGYPCGMLGNVAPKEFADLLVLIIGLGKGNERRGIKKAISILGSHCGLGR